MVNPSVIIAHFTDYDSETNYFSTRSVDAVSKEIMLINQRDVMVVKSIVCADYIKQFSKNPSCSDVIFRVELLRQDKTHYDNFYQGRVVVARTKREC